MRTLMGITYAGSSFSTPVGGADRIAGWLTGRAEEATGERQSRLRQAAAAVEALSKSDEPVSLTQAEAIGVAGTLRAEAQTTGRPEGDADDAALREHAGELASAIDNLAADGEIIHLQLL